MSDNLEEQIARVFFCFFPTLPRARKNQRKMSKTEAQSKPEAEDDDLDEWQVARGSI